MIEFIFSCIIRSGWNSECEDDLNVAVLWNDRMTLFLIRSF